MNNNNALKFDSILLRGNEEKNIINVDGLAVLNIEAPHIKIGVHSGMYHADDALAVALIKLTHLGKDIAVVRSRNQQDWEDCDLLIDVGEGLLDHHGTRAENGIAACSRVLQLLLQSMEPGIPMADFLEEVVKPMVETVALQDTGTAVDNHPFPWVHAMASYDAIEARAGEGDAAYRFESAVRRIYEELQERFYVFYVKRRAQSAAERLIEANPQEKVLVVPDDCREADIKNLLWEHKHPAIYYVSKEAENDYRVLCSASLDEEFSYFGSKKLIPERYRGLRAAELAAATGIDGAIFCHAAGFIAGFDTAAGAEAFAELCIEG